MSEAPPIVIVLDPRGGLLTRIALGCIFVLALLGAAAVGRVSAEREACAHVSGEALFSEAMRARLMEQSRCRVYDARADGEGRWIVLYDVSELLGCALDLPRPDLGGPGLSLADDCL